MAKPNPIQPLPIPQRGENQNDFNVKMNGFVNGLSTATIQGINDHTDYVEEQAAEAEVSAANAANSANTAVSTANNKGEWSLLTGPLDVKSSVSHNNQIWIPKENLADVTLFEPGVSDKWQIIPNGYGTNLLSNHNFLTPSPDAITHPSATPTDYVAGTQIFSGVTIGTDAVGLTLIDGRVSMTSGTYQFKVPNKNGLERVPAFTASVADYDGNPRLTGVSFALIGDEYVITVANTATDVFSVKFEQGSVATGHEIVENLSRRIWEALSGAVNVKSHGAKGTGSRIDGSGSDIDTQAINNAVVEAFLSGKSVYFPGSAGAYLIDGPILCSKYVNFYGDGPFTTEISVQKNCPNIDFIMFHLIDDGSVGNEKNNRYVSFNDMSIDGNFNEQLAGNTHIGVRLENAIFCSFNNVEIKQCEQDVQLTGCANVAFTGSTILRDSRKVSLRLDGCTGIKADKSVLIRSGREIGIAVTGTPSDNCSFPCTFSANLKYAFFCDNASFDIDTNGARYNQNGSATFETDASAFFIGNSSARQINCKGAEFYQVLGKCIDSNAIQSSYDDNAIDACRRDAIRVMGNDSHANDNDIYDAGYTTDNTYDAITLGAGNNTANNNKIRSRRFAEVAKAGIRILPTATNPQYYDNDIIGPTTAIVKDAGVTGERHARNRGAGDNDLLQLRLTSSQALTGGVVKVEFDNEYFNSEGAFDAGGFRYVYNGPNGGIIEILCNIRGATLTTLRAKIVDNDDTSNASFLVSGDNFQILDRVIINQGQVVYIECDGSGTIDNNSTFNIKSIGR